jgi:hypothetical protein
MRETKTYNQLLSLSLKNNIYNERNKNIQPTSLKTIIEKLKGKVRKPQVSAP